jgi:hypothetical protein
MEAAVRTILDCVGEDATRPGLEDTPTRVAKAYEFMTQGYAQNPREVINDAIFPEDHDDMVVVRVSAGAAFTGLGRGREGKGQVQAVTRCCTSWAGH